MGQFKYVSSLELRFKEQRNKFLEDLEGYNQEVDQLAECGNLRQVDESLGCFKGPSFIKFGLRGIFIQ